ncbi:MAG: ABC-2 transporter permease [Oscillospiraceae bacterium]|nr:ABC-2 transporter permease [Oscillospiraceae bacterium]
MKKLLQKELKLSASVLSYLFIAFGLMAFIPGYPILVGSFFVCLGMFQSFQCTREANDITYTALLPVAKSDVVRAKYAFCIFIELCYFVLTAAVTLIRMVFLSDAAVYRQNALMNANFTYLAFVLVILGLFNIIFVGGFFKTAYKFGKPFVMFIVAAFLVVGLGETLFHIPGLSAQNAFGFTHMGLQAGMLAAGIALYVAMTVVSQNRSVRNFEKIDL